MIINLRPKYRVRKFSNYGINRFTALGVNVKMIWWNTPDATYTLTPLNTMAWIHLLLCNYVDYHINRK